MTRHMQREVNKLKRRILKLGKVVEDTLNDAIASIKDRDVELARQVIERDVDIDSMEVDTEEECLKLLALYQPVAIDLRFIIGTLKMNNDLERIGDLTANIAERTCDLAKTPRASVPKELFEMAAQVNDMVEKSMQAMVNMDVDMAREVCAADDEVDDSYRKMYEDFAKSAQKAPKKVDFLLLILSVGRYLERIADHATNIAEDVIYMVAGEISRHGVIEQEMECE